MARFKKDKLTLYILILSFLYEQTLILGSKAALAAFFNKIGEWEVTLLPLSYYKPE
jgi:hypothetical protein